MYSGAPQCDGKHVKAYCCPASVSSGSCGWYGREDPISNKCVGNHCASNQIQVGRDINGGGFNCMQGTLNSFHGSAPPTWQDVPLVLCCSATELSIVRQYFYRDISSWLTSCRIYNNSLLMSSKSTLASLLLFLANW